MANTARSNLLTLRGGYFQQLADARALLAQLPERSEEAAEASRWLAEVQSEIKIIEDMLRSLGND